MYPRWSVPGLRDSDGHVIGYLCINVDTTALDTLRNQLDTLLGAPATEAVPTTDFPTNFDAALDQILLFEYRNRGKELNELTKAERAELLRRIDERGLLKARGAVRRITRLGVCRAAIYQDLKEENGRA